MQIASALLLRIVRSIRSFPWDAINRSVVDVPHNLSDPSYSSSNASVYRHTNLHTDSENQLGVWRPFILQLNYEIVDMICVQRVDGET